MLLPNHNPWKTPSFLSPFISLSLFFNSCSTKIPHKMLMETDSYVDSWVAIYWPEYHTTATNSNIFTLLVSCPKKKWPPYFCLNEFNNLCQPCHTQSPDGPCYVNILSSVHAVGLFTAYKRQRWRASVCPFEAAWACCIAACTLLLFIDSCAAPHVNQDAIKCPSEMHMLR